MASEVSGVGIRGHHFGDRGVILREVGVRAFQGLANDLTQRRLTATGRTTQTELTRSTPSSFRALRARGNAVQTAPSSLWPISTPRTSRRPWAIATVACNATSWVIRTFQYIASRNKCWSSLPPASDPGGRRPPPYGPSRRAIPPTSRSRCPQENAGCWPVSEYIATTTSLRGLRCPGRWLTRVPPGCGPLWARIDSGGASIILAGAGSRRGRRRWPSRRR